MKNEEKKLQRVSLEHFVELKPLISEECILSSIVFETKEVGLKYLPDTRGWENLKIDLGRGSIQVCEYKIPYKYWHTILFFI